jgi:hypothetical protein
MVRGFDHDEFSSCVSDSFSFKISVACNCGRDSVIMQTEATHRLKSDGMRPFLKLPSVQFKRLALLCSCFLSMNEVIQLS